MSSRGSLRRHAGLRDLQPPCSGRWNQPEYFDLYVQMRRDQTCRHFDGSFFAFRVCGGGAVGGRYLQWYYFSIKDGHVTVQDDRKNRCCFSAMACNVVWK